MQADQPDDSEFYDEEPMNDSPAQSHESPPSSQSPQPMVIPSPSPQNVSRPNSALHSQTESQLPGGGNDIETRNENGFEHAVESQGNSQENLDTVSDSEMVDVEMGDEIIGMDDSINVSVSQNSDLNSSPRSSPSPIPVRDLSKEPIHYSSS